MLWEIWGLIFRMAFCLFFRTPFFRVMVLLVFLARVLSWVTIRRLVLDSLAVESSMSKTSRAVLGSRLPVGSSARIRAGLLATARAMATRCCSPPESSEGRWSRRFDSLRDFRIFLAFSMASFSGVLWMIWGMMMFSRAVNSGRR